MIGIVLIFLSLSPWDVFKQTLVVDQTGQIWDDICLKFKTNSKFPMHKLLMITELNKSVGGTL